MSQKSNRPTGEAPRYARALANLEGALGRFRDQAVRLGSEERARAIRLLLKAADEIVRLRFIPIPGKEAVAMYLDELSEDAAALEDEGTATS
jgi:hypothetical protein